MDGGEVEEHAGWHRLVRHGLLVGELGDVGPVLLALGSDGPAMASVTGLRSAPVSSSPKRASSEVTLTPSGSVTRTGGSGLPAPVAW